MRKSVFVIILIIYSFTLQGQFVFEKCNLNKVRSFEDSMKSECYGLTKININADFFEGAKENFDYLPLKYRRNNDSFFPTCEVEYFYTDNDSIVHVIFMEWNIMNYVKNLNTYQKLLGKQVKRKNEYFVKYDQLKNEISRTIGEPTYQTEISEFSDGYYGETLWKLSDKKLKLTMSFTPKLKKVGKYRFGTFRIRLITTLK